MSTRPVEADPQDVVERLSVVEEPDDSRFVLLLDGQRVGLADYSISNEVMTIPHVETAPAHRGKNFAAHLMGAVLDEVRARSLTVRPLCPYAAAYMQRRPDTHDLIAS